MLTSFQTLEFHIVTDGDIVFALACSLQVLEKYSDANAANEPLDSPSRVPHNLRVRRDSWVQDEGDEVGTDTDSRFSS